MKIEVKYNNNNNHFYSGSPKQKTRDPKQKENWGVQDNQKRKLWCVGSSERKVDGVGIQRKSVKAASEKGNKKRKNKFQQLNYK